jgi:hypothetical protein
LQFEFDIAAESLPLRCLIVRGSEGVPVIDGYPADAGAYTARLSVPEGDTSGLPEADILSVAVVMRIEVLYLAVETATDPDLSRSDISY